MRINEVTYEKLKTPLKVNGNLKECTKTSLFYVEKNRDRAYSVVLHRTEPKCFCWLVAQMCSIPFVFCAR